MDLVSDSSGRNTPTISDIQSSVSGNRSISASMTEHSDGEAGYAHDLEQNLDESNPIVRYAITNWPIKPSHDISGLETERQLQRTEDNHDPDELYVTSRSQIGLSEIGCNSGECLDER